MKIALRRRFVRWGLWLVAILAAPLLLFPVVVSQVATYPLATVWLGLTVVFVRAVWMVWRDPATPARTLHFVIGVAGVGISICTAVLWTIGAYITGWPWMVTSPVVGGYVLMFIISGAVLLTTPGPDGHVPPQNLRILWIMLGLGLLIGLAVWGFGWERGLAPAPI